LMGGASDDTPEPAPEQPPIRTHRKPWFNRQGQ